MYIYIYTGHEIYWLVILAIYIYIIWQSGQLCWTGTQCVVYKHAWCHLHTSAPQTGGTICVNQPNRINIHTYRYIRLHKYISGTLGLVLISNRKFIHSKFNGWFKHLVCEITNQLMNSNNVFAGIKKPQWSDITPELDQSWHLFDAGVCFTKVFYICHWPEMPTSQMEIQNISRWDTDFGFKIQNKICYSVKYRFWL